MLGGRGPRNGPGSKNVQKESSIPLVLDCLVVLDPLDWMIRTLTGKPRAPLNLHRRRSRLMFFFGGGCSPMFLLYQEPKLIDRNPPPSSVGVEIPFLLSRPFLIFIFSFPPPPPSPNFFFSISFCLSSCCHTTYTKVDQDLHCWAEEEDQLLARSLGKACGYFFLFFVLLVGQHQHYYPLL